MGLCLFVTSGDLFFYGLTILDNRYIHNVHTFITFSIVRCNIFYNCSRVMVPKIKRHIKMANLASNFSMKCIHCTERKERHERLYHGDCKTSIYDHLNIYMSVHGTKDNCHFKIEGPWFFQCVRPGFVR